MKYYITNDELYHHGILGQKWGVRRFQNKDGSLTSAGRSRQRSMRAYRNEKAGKKGKDRTGTDALSEYDNRYRYVGRTYNITMDTEDDRGHSYNKSFEKSGYWIGKGSNEYYETNKDGSRDPDNYYSDYYKKDRTNRLEARHEAVQAYKAASDFAKRNGLDINDVTYKDENGNLAVSPAAQMSRYYTGKKLTSAEDIQKAAANVNDRYFTQAGYNMNCAGCSSVMTLKKMGYDGISAASIADGVHSKVGVTAWFSGAHQESCNSVEDMQNKILSQGVGSFGELSGSRYVKDTTGSNVRVGGHSMSYTVLEGGKIQVENSQVPGSIYNSLKEAFENQGFSSTDGMQFTRLDNTKPNFKNMALDGIIADEKNRNKSHLYWDPVFKDTSTGEAYKLPAYAMLNYRHSNNTAPKFKNI